MLAGRRPREIDPAWEPSDEPFAEATAHVPCHRVIGAAGGLTGFGGGIERKRALLELEAGILGLPAVSR
jgi:hypothetical protein